MGTWDAGLLDNDCAHDGVGTISDGVVSDILALGAEKPTSARVDTLGAAVGILLQLSTYDFDPTAPNGPKVAAAVAAWKEPIATLSPPARDVLEAVGRGEGRRLAERRSSYPNDVTKVVGTRFGAREEALFASKAAHDYVATVADRCIAAADEDFDSDAVTDLCREAYGMGALAVLFVIAPYARQKKKVDHWRSRAREALETLESQKDSELEFHREYYANVDRALGVLADL